jgi:hypothetical protein
MYIVFIVCIAVGDVYYLQNDLRKRRISEILVIVAIVLLSIDTAETFIAQGGKRFLPLTDQEWDITWYTINHTLLLVFWGRI